MRVLIGLLIASLGINVWLLARREAPEAVEVPEVVEVKRGEPIVFRPSPTRPASYGVYSRGELEQRIVAVEAEIETCLRPGERFARGAPRSTATEDRIRPYLDMVFRDLPGKEPKYTVECRALTCKLEALVEADTNDWVGPLQTMPGRQVLFATMSFGRGGTFLEVHDEAAALAAEVDVGAAEVVYRCLRTDATGDLSYQLAMDSAGRIVVEMGGSLRDAPVGRCVRTALEDQIAKTKVPPGVQIEHIVRRWDLPLEGD